MSKHDVSANDEVSLICSTLIRWVKLIGLTAVLLISLVDYFVIVDISLSILYLLPIALVSWYESKRFSLLMVFICTIGWFIAELSAKSNMHLSILAWNTTVRLVVFWTIAYLLSDLKSAYEREKNLAQTDVLTGIVNRRFFWEKLQLEYQRSLRYNRCFTLAYLDLDNFKQINDRFGHQTGDKLLKLVARTMQRQIREVDTAARLGGDEFALLLPETNYISGKLVLERLQKNIMSVISAYTPPVSLSIGAITFVDLPDSVDRTINDVDALMYQVKNSGKNDIRHELFKHS